jgi:hypothetical protein
MANPNPRRIQHSGPLHFRITNSVELDGRIEVEIVGEFERADTSKRLARELCHLIAAEKVRLGKRTALALRVKVLHDRLDVPKVKTHPRTAGQIATRRKVHKSSVKKILWGPEPEF